MQCTFIKLVSESTLCGDPLEVIEKSVYLDCCVSLGGGVTSDIDLRITNLKSLMPISLIFEAIVILDWLQKSTVSSLIVLNSQCNLVLAQYLILQLNASTNHVF